MSAIFSRSCEYGIQAVLFLAKNAGGGAPIHLRTISGGTITSGSATRAIVFTADLVRHLKVEHEVEFVRLSSYGKARTSSGTVTIIKDVQADIRDKHVLIIEEIIDSGLAKIYQSHLDISREIAQAGGEARQHRIAPQPRTSARTGEATAPMYAPWPPARSAFRMSAPKPERSPAPA